MWRVPPDRNVWDHVSSKGVFSSLCRVHMSEFNLSCLCPTITVKYFVDLGWCRCCIDAIEKTSWTPIEAVTSYSTASFHARCDARIMVSHVQFWNFACGIHCRAFLSYTRASVWTPFTIYKVVSLVNVSVSGSHESTSAFHDARSSWSVVPLRCNLNHASLLIGLIFRISEIWILQTSVPSELVHMVDLWENKLICWHPWVAVDIARSVAATARSSISRSSIFLCDFFAVCSCNICGLGISCYAIVQLWGSLLVSQLWGARIEIRNSLSLWSITLELFWE